jgi:hypothetical protein
VQNCKPTLNARSLLPSTPLCLKVPAHSIYIPAAWSFVHGGLLRRLHPRNQLPNQLLPPLSLRPPHRLLSPLALSTSSTTSSALEPVLRLPLKRIKLE